MNRTSVQTCLIGLLLVALGVCGYWLLFTQFMVYDDEGYVLWSLHNYFREGGLYSHVYSQYGPFLYVLYDGIHRLFRIDFDNETGRALTLIYWLVSSGLSGLFVWRQTRSALGAAAAITITFGTLLIMISEPIHPGGLIAMITAIAAVGGAWALERKAYRIFALLCAGCGAALVLTKINVGAFFLIATGSWFALHVASGKWVRPLLWLTAGGSLLLPLWLMNKLWPEPWVATYALAFSAAALALLLLFGNHQRSSLNGWHLSLLIWSTFAFAAIILSMVWVRGTDLPTLWHGIAIAPLGQPIAYAHAVRWPTGMPLLIVAMFGFALWHHFRNSTWSSHLISLLRIVVTIGLFVTTFRSIDNRLTFFSFHYGLAFAWIMAVPIGDRPTNFLISARLWLAWIFIWQTLHAYPVAGSQMGWGAFLWIPLAITGIHEAVRYWMQRLPQLNRSLRITTAATAGLGIASVLWNLGYVSHQRFTLGEPLGLTGAASLRLSDDLTSLYRILDKNIRTHGDTLFSYPGLFSLNIWTERPTPTAQNVTHWFSLLADDKQQAIIEQLKQDDRAVIVAQSYLINYLVYNGFPPRSALQRYIVDNFHAVFAIDTYQFWVKKHRTVAPISTAGLYTNQQTGDSILQLTTDGSGKAATIEIRGLFHPFNRVSALSSSSDVPWTITPLHPDNSPAAAPYHATGPVGIEGLTRIEIPVSNVSSLPSLDLLKLVIKDDTGHVLDSLQFTQ